MHLVRFRHKTDVLIALTHVCFRGKADIIQTFLDVRL
jgi:hypothetical protein